MRVEIPEVIWQSTTIAGSAALAPKPGASVEVRLRNAGNTVGVTINDAETAGGTLANPLTADSLGRLFGWLEEGSYDFIVDGDTANTFRYEAVRGQRTDIILGSDVRLSRVAANVLGLDAGDGIAIPGASVAALPGSPQDGQIISYKADPTNGIVWLFQYRSASASASKWEFIGGAPLFSEVTTDETLTVVGGAYVSLTTAGPQITVPLPGDYYVEIGNQNYVSAGTATFSLMSSYQIGATLASDNDAFQTQYNSLNFIFSDSSRPRRKNGLAAGTLLDSKYKILAGTTPTAHWYNRYMRVTPIRVGP